ncbi:translation initiation factor 2 [Pannonibacter tanglangensis]|uniref:Translation initiation factor 2 n=1 Tax=Pannonibacter tanglangensis TaxID=2750084 RepID=A0ABW9ZMT8_9HYPH|nr:translation initiation factor 2 [Pannonibacter sp. XCT-34]NBN64334.1 translation initiation factor 2 [Pannonibacter sp. XCT-34]
MFRFVRLSHASKAFAVLVLLTGCASITRGTTETFIVEVSPADALVTTSLGGSCRASPCVFTDIARDADFSVRIERAGYKPETFQISHGLEAGGAAGAAGNAGIPVVGVVGLLIDANTGATQALSPNPLRVSLKPDRR